MRHASPILVAALLAAAAGVACLGPYQIIGQELSPTISLGEQPTWIQATPELTTLLVFAVADGGITAPFTLTTIARNQSTVIYTGTYFATPTEVTLNSTLKYVLNNQNDIPVTQRTGSQRFDVDAGATYARVIDGGILTLTGSPSLGSFVAFPTALAGLRATNQAEAECLMLVYELSVLSSETRILGFNGASIIQYTNPATFSGVLTGSVNINVESLLNPNVNIVYSNYSDFSGFFLDGNQYTVTNLSGDGHVSSVVDFRMMASPPDGGAPETVISGSVGYGNPAGSPPSILIAEGTPSGGSYLLSVDGGASFLLSYTVLNDIDVTGCVVTPP
jgi:hypothetical protein